MTEHTKKTRLFEEAYSYLVDAHSEIKFTELTDFEENRAAKLLRFCECMIEQFKDDERINYALKNINKKN